MPRDADNNVIDLTPPPGPKDGRAESAETVKFQTIKQECATMMRAYRKLTAATTHYNQLVKDVAARSNSTPSVLKQLVKSSADGTYHDTRAQLDKAAIIFENIGQIPIAQDGEDLIP